MNDNPASGPRSPDPFPALRIVALIAAILGVLVLAAAAFVLSYPGIHQLARTAGMSVTLARLFPVIFDALLVVSLAAVLSLHGAGWWRRGYSWLITLLLLAAMAAGGVLHALHPHIPHRPAAVTAAVLPWALLLIAFSLLLSMLRQFRQPRLSPTARPPADHAASAPDATEPRTRLDELLASGGTRIIPAQPSRTHRPPPPTPAAPIPATQAPVPAAPIPASQAPPVGRTSTVPIARPVPPGPTPDRAPAGQLAASPAHTEATAAASADTKPSGTGRADSGRAGPEPASPGPADTGTTGPRTAERKPSVISPAAAPADAGTADGHADRGGRADTKPTDTGAAGAGPADVASNGAGPVSAPDQAGTAPARAEPAAAPPDETPADGTDSAPAPSPRADRPAPVSPATSPAGRAIHVPQQPMRAPVPAPSPHFDRLRSTPTPPEDDTDSDA